MTENSPSTLTLKKIPQCIAIVFDGNRRWAKEKGLPSLFGHERGYERVKDLVLWAKRRGVKHIIGYAFSEENWKREDEEVDYLMDLCRRAFKTDLSFFIDHEVRITVIGDHTRLNHDIIKDIAHVEEKTCHCKGVHFVVALSYGGRVEIINAISTLRVKNPEKPITEQELEDALWTSRLGVPHPEIVFRPGGELRLSNFLLWQAAYAELIFSKKYWPDITDSDLDAVLIEFNNRERRFGK